MKSIEWQTITNETHNQQNKDKWDRFIISNLLLDSNSIKWRAIEKIDFCENLLRKDSFFRNRFAWIYKSYKIQKSTIFRTKYSIISHYPHNNNTFIFLGVHSVDNCVIFTVSIFISQISGETSGNVDS